MKNLIKTAVSLILVFSAAAGALSSCTLGQEEEVEITILTQVDESTEGLVTYVNSLIDKYYETKPGSDWNKKYSVSDGSVKFRIAGTDETNPVIDSVNLLAPQVKKFILNGDFGDMSGENEYGEEPAASILSRFDPELIPDATIEEYNNSERYSKIVFYLFELPENFFEEGAEIPDSFIDPETIDAVFGLIDTDKIVTEFASMKDVLVVSGAQASYKNARVEFLVDRSNDELLNVRYYCYADVTLSCAGAGTIAEAGDMDCIFSLESKTEFDFDWEE
ncbi:MAG: hypothetical protein K6C36_09320 [Clostridia bacterium]|nr:hypothetical protein [Clostridia bacterium]